MTVKLIGALLVIVGSGGFGFCVAAAHRREERILRQMVGVLEYIVCELQYRQTPLPQLCRQAALECSGMLNKLFLALAAELDMQVSPDVHMCMKAALGKFSDIPMNLMDLLHKLGRCLGRFDLSGQLKDLEAICQECKRRLGQISENRDVRLRTYQTLGLCAGAALVILFI